MIQGIPCEDEKVPLISNTLCEQGAFLLTYGAKNNLIQQVNGGWKWPVRKVEPCLASQTVSLWWNLMVSSENSPRCKEHIWWRDTTAKKQGCATCRPPGKRRVSYAGQIVKPSRKICDFQYQYMKVQHEKKLENPTFGSDTGRLKEHYVVFRKTF